MHVCELVRLLPGHAAGGMQTHALLLARWLVRLGHRVTLFTAEAPGRLEEWIEDVCVVYVPGTQPDRHTPAGWEALNRAWDSYHARDPFDVVHAHSSAGEGWARRSRPGRPPLVVTMHGTHRGEWLTSLRSLRGRPLGQAKSSLYLWSTYLQVAARYLPRAQAVIYTSTTDFRRGRRLYPLPLRRAMIPTGVDVERFSPAVQPAELRAELGLDAATPLIVGAGRMVREKGFSTAVEALAGWTGPRPHLVLLGDGPAVGELRAEAARLGLDAEVSQRPTVSHELLPRYLNAADLFVFPTWREEGSPNGVLEAMACGLPIVASDLGAVRDMVGGGEAAALVPPMDPAALRDAMIGLLSDRARAGRLGRAARRRAEERFSAERMAARTAALFEQLVAGVRPE